MNEQLTCVGERVTVKVANFTFTGGRSMWIFACCASLGALLSVRFGAFVLVPGSAFVVGVTAVFGTLNEWSALALVLVTITNLIAFQVSYGIVGLVLQAVGIEPAERQAVGLWHKNSKF
jgi:hypothetical protein